MTLLALPWIVLLTLVAPWLFPFVFGEEWRQSGFYLRILAVLFFVEVVVSPTSETVDALHRQDLHLLREIMRLAMYGAAVGAMVGLSLGPTAAVMILSGVGTVTNLAYCLISYYAIRRHIGRHERQAGPSIGKEPEHVAAAG